MTDVLAAFSKASAEADAIDRLLHAGPAYCPDDDPSARSRRFSVNNEAWGRMGRILHAFLDRLIHVCRNSFRLSATSATSEAPASGMKQPPAGGQSSGELISHFAFPQADDRERKACALRARNDPA